MENQIVKTDSYISVYHRAFEDVAEIKKVAEVSVNKNADLESNVDFAWRVTQNIEGSWSKGRYFSNGEANEDYSPYVKVVAPLELGSDGKEWGHRSSSIGDVYVLEGKAYVVNDRENTLALVDLDEILKLDGRASIKHLFN
jgi:hypothetical protein